MAVFAGWQLYASVQQFKEDNDLSKIQPDGSLSQKTAQDTILPAPLTANKYRPVDFTIIPEKNVFSESRTSEASADSPAISGTMPSTVKPVLVGVILSENQKIASLQEPPGRARSTQVQAKKIGDTYEGYTITAIESDHIELSNGNLKELVYLNDSSRPAQRTKTTIISTRVIPIGGRTTAANTPTYVVLDSNRRPVSVQIPTPPQSPNSGAAGAQSNIIMVNPTTVQSGILPQGIQPQSTPTSQVNPPEATNPGGAPTRRSRVIQSPFGDIIRNPQNQ